MQKQRVTGQLIKALSLIPLLICVVSLPVSGTEGGSGEKLSSLSAEKLVKQLGDESFYTREKAMATLIAAGPDVEETVRAALDSEDAEIRYRSEIVLIEIDKSQQESRRAAFVEGDTGKLKSNVKSWERFSKMVGNNRESRELFVAMLNGGEDLLTAGEKGGRDASTMISQLYTAHSNARRFGDQAVTPGGVMAMLFVASDNETKLDSSATSRVTSMLSQFRNQLDGKFPAFKLLMGQMVRSSTGTQQIQMLRLADQFKLKKDGLVLARKMAGSGHTTYRAQAMILMGKLGEKEDAAELAKYIEDNSALGNHVVRNGKRRETKLGDVALAMSIVLSGEDPTKFGFPEAPKGRPTSMSYYNYGFYDKTKRAEARKKWLAKLDPKASSEK